MSSYISEDIRRQVIARANRLCEYCLIHEDDTFFGCQVDHIISIKHGGPTSLDNLAYACSFCNRQKGSDISTLNWQTGKLVRFFNPRTDHWAAYFRLDVVLIEPLNEIGEATIRILGFNEENRILERRLLIEVGRFPSDAALKLLSQ
jgi:hypothetical protein